MKKIDELHDIAIIGCGPRGLSALESLFKVASQQNTIPTVLVFEASDYPGAGPVYGLNQTESNWLNVCERAVDIPSRTKIFFENFSIPPFPDFQDWSGYTKQHAPETAVDKFPPRSKMGEYLNARFESIAKILKTEKVMALLHGEVHRIDWENGKVTIDMVGGVNYQAKEAVLCIGHQPIELDEQLTRWQKRATRLDTIDLFKQPYPTSRILESSVVRNGSAIAIRGFGLAMIDVVRALSEGLEGKFEVTDEKTRKMRYVLSGKEPDTIMPFSLDGLPMAPKPLNKKIDRLYVPSPEELSTYETSVTQSMESSEPPESTDFLIRAISPIITKKFLALGVRTFDHSLSASELTEIIESWLSNAAYSHELIVSKTLPAATTMRKFIDMATGTDLVSLDFCIGHVWRHCQPTMYRLLSFAPLPDELIAAIVNLDERLKRYSYGPPVDSLQQVLALDRAGVLNLDFVKDPDIKLNENGWEFSLSNQKLTAEVMINSVLDAPQILKVVSPLPKGLINTSFVEPLHDKLGVRTKKNALVESENTEEIIPIALLGRLAKGTLIGVDAIAECFGIRSEFWAEGVVERLRNKPTST